MPLSVDPATGKPIVNDAANPPKVIQLTEDEWTKMNQRLDAFERTSFNANNRPPQPPAAPPGPTVADQLSTIDADLAKLDEQIDSQIEVGKGVSKLMRQRDTLNAKRLRLQIKSEDIDPALSEGVRTIDYLSAEISRGKMPHYDVVKDDMESALANMPASQRMNPEVRQMAYNMAVGQNIDKIADIQKEQILRESADSLAAGTPPGNNGRNGQRGGEDIPKAEEFLSQTSLDAISSAGKTPDEYFRRQGFEDGFAGWYKKYHAPKKEGE